jgi:hypothetical protein
MGDGYRPTDWNGAQLFLYPATEEGEHSRLRDRALTHLLPRRNPRPGPPCPRMGRGPRRRVLHAPRLFPEYGDTFYATFFLDPHGFHLEVVTFENV